MAVAIVNAAVQTYEVVFPGSKNEIWYQIDRDTWNPYRGGQIEQLSVNIETVSIISLQFSYLIPCCIFFKYNPYTLLLT